MKKREKSFKGYWRIFRLCISFSLKASVKYFVYSLALSLIQLAFPLAQVYFTSRMLGTLASGAGVPGTVETFTAYCLGLLLVTLLSKAAGNFSTYCRGMHRDLLSRHVHYAVMEKAAELDLSYFDSSGFYNEINDIGINENYLIVTAFSLIDFARYLFQLLTLLAAFSTFSIWGGIAFVLAVIPNIIAQNKQISAVYNIQRDNWNVQRKTYYAKDLMTNRDFSKDVRIYHLLDFAKERYAWAFGQMIDKKHRVSKKYTILLSLSVFLPELLSVFFVIYLGAQVLSGQLLLEDYSYYQGLAVQVMSAVFALVGICTQIGDGKLRIEKLADFLEWKSSVVSGPLAVTDSARFEIEFRDVSFRYDDSLPWVLRHLSFTIGTKEKVALVGKNGEGKTTVIKLLLRFYDPTEGEILLNGKSLKEYDTEFLRGQFSTMFQDYCRYAFTVEESVALEQLDGNRREKVLRSLRESGIYDYVETLSEKEKTYLTRQWDESGIELSGGQWQKIALARTFYHKARMFVFDEPSAALDAEAEDELFTRFRTLYQDIGAVFITHRLSNVVEFDKILVLKDGTLAEQGTHRQLIRQNGLYAHLFALQAEKYQEREA